MKFVYPIKDVRKITQIKNILKGDDNIRDYLLFELGLNATLRITDLLSIRVMDLYDENLEPKDYFEIVEKKTGKINKITITPKVKETLLVYKEKYTDICIKNTNFIFFNKKSLPLGNKPIGRIMAWNFMSKIGKDVGLSGISTHSFRKSWGYAARKSGVPLEIIQHKLNHSSLSITKRYLGITDEEIMEACVKLDL